MTNQETVINLIADALDPALWSQVLSGAQTGDDLSVDLVNAIDDFDANVSPATGAVVVETWNAWDARYRLAAPDTALDIQDAQTSPTCICCDQPMEVQEQCYSHTDKVNRQVTCRTPGCELEDVTACLDSYDQTVSAFLANPPQVDHA